MRFLILIFTFLIVLCLNSKALETDVRFTFTDPAFGISQTTNRTVIVQAESGTQVQGGNVLLPFKITGVTDTNGIFTVSNLFGSAISGYYHVTIPAPPQRADFDIWVQNTNLGLIQASTILGVFGASTYPAAVFAWGAAVSDARYSTSTNSGITQAQLNITSNAIVQLIPSTNGFVTELITNGYATTNYVFQFFYLNSNPSNYPSFNLVSNYASGNFYPTSNPSGFVDRTITNNYATQPFVTNTFAGLLNSGTNNLATQPFVTNASLGLLSVGTNGFIRLSDATNVTLALQSVGTNGYVRSNAVLALIFDGTNGYVRSTITNGLFSGVQTTNAVLGLVSVATNTLFGYVTNSIIITSNGLLSRIDATNNFIQISNGGGTNTTLVTSPAITVTNFTARNDVNMGGRLVTNLSKLVFYPVSFTPNTSGYEIIPSGGVDNQLPSSAAQSSLIFWSQGSAVGQGVQYSMILGGVGNNLSQSQVYNTIIGGWSNQINSSTSISNAYASGVNTLINKNSVWIWSADEAGQFASTTNNQFLIRAKNGVAIGTNSAGANAANQLRVAGNVDSSGANAGFTINGVSITTSQTNGLPSMAFQPTNSFINATNGTANNGSQGFFSIGGGYTFITSTNVFGSTNAGTASGNGTWIFNGVDLTNKNDITHIVFSSPNYLLMSGATTLYLSTSIIGTWSVVSGSAPAPTFFLGMYADDSGVVWTGSGGGFTNLLNVSWGNTTNKILPIRPASVYYYFTNGQPLYGIISTN